MPLQWSGFHFHLSVRGWVDVLHLDHETNIISGHLECQARKQRKIENNLSKAKAGQAEPHFRPAIVPLLDLLLIYYFLYTRFNDF